MKPYVICHMCTTIDGKILTERWGKLPGGQSGASLFDTTARRFGVTAWLVGTTTMREFDHRNASLKVTKVRIPRVDHLAAPRAKRLAIAADARGVLRFKRGEVGGDHVLLLITDQVSNEFLAHLQRAGVSYLFCGRRRIDLGTALDKLARTVGLRHLLLEGGGTFNGAMLKAGLIDEISQVIVPVIDGAAGIASIFDLPGRAPRRAAASLRAIAHRTLPGSVLWLRYRVVSR